MKRLRYQVAVSLDGFIAGPDGEYRLDRVGFVDRLRRLVQGIRHGRHGTQDLRSADGTGRERHADRPRCRGVLTEPSTQDSERHTHHQGRCEWRRCGAQETAGAGYLALRWRRPVSFAPRRRARGHGGSGIDTCAARKRDSVVAAWRSGDTRTLRSKSSPGERYRHALVSRQGEARAWRPHPIHQGSKARRQRTPSRRSTTGTPNSASKRAGKKRSARGTKSV